MLPFIVISVALLVPMQVRPSSFWAAYELKNENRLPLPSGATIHPVRIFADSPPRKLLLFNEYDSKSPYFGGRRLEANVIVRIRGKTHFVVVDYITNAIAWNPIRGVHLPNSQMYNHKMTQSRIKTRIRDMRGEFFNVDGVCENDATRRITLDFAVRPNRECFFRDHPYSVKLQFDPHQICHPVSLVDATVDTSILRDHQGEFLMSFVHPFSMNFNMTLNHW
mgnify:CR=1 FL=1